MATLLPGSKGWINKYMELVKKGRIDLTVDRSTSHDIRAFIHIALGRTGIFFGYPSRMQFAKDLDDSQWTTEEKLKLLLFESHLFVYQSFRNDAPFDQNLFLNTLHAFYGQHGSTSVKKIMSFFMKESREEQLESILNKRADIEANYLDNQLWVNYLNNFFIYLDVILFFEFLQSEEKATFYQYDECAMNALTAITLAAHSDGLVDKKERDLFDVFLASANLSDSQRDVAISRYDVGASVEDFTDLAHSNWMLKRFLLDLSTFVIFSNHEAGLEEKAFLKDLTRFLNLGDNDLNESLALTEQFVINNFDKLPFLSRSSSLEKMYGNLSKRWIKILGRNKDKLATELKQSKELVALIRKSTSTELTKQEKELVKTQFKDIVRSMPSLAIFMLPGGAVLLPLVLKIIPDLVPSAFRDNAIDKE
jgi:hypothetical protein